MTRRRDDEPQALRGLTDAEKVEHLLYALRTITTPPKEDMQIMERFGVKLSRQQARIVGVLIASAGQIVSRDALRTAMYWDRVCDDEPESDVAKVQIMHIKRKLAARRCPLEIRGHNQGGGHSAHWLVEPVE